MVCLYLLIFQMAVIHNTTKTKATGYSRSWRTDEVTRLDDSPLGHVHIVKCTHHDPPIEPRDRVCIIPRPYQGGMHRPQR